MADSTQNESVWGFISYAKNNPYGTISGAQWDDIEDMASMYLTVNYTAMNDTPTAADPESYGAAAAVPAPDNAGAGLVDAGGTVTVTPTANAYAGAMYPQRGYGG